ncbi:hypothetical protein AB0B66_28015 [Catellatospora sp. NPDC049111]|uniref:hypothetical protein n=1 Tax=Catellatospora sp. NPDC049111 TaxID=3155271 RepID=UPI0033C6ECF3
MAENRVKHEFNRMELTARMERDREIIAKYEVGREFHRERVENTHYELGRLDEKLGGRP